MFSEERLRERAERTLKKSCVMTSSLPQLHHVQTTTNELQREVMKIDKPVASYLMLCVC